MQNDPVIKKLEDRIVHLERQGAKFRAGFILTACLLLILSASVGLRAVSAQSDGDDVVFSIVECHSLRVVGDNNETLIELTTDEIDGPKVRLYGSMGSEAVVLDANSAGWGGGIRTYGTEGDITCEFGTVRGWGPGFTICNNEGHRRAELLLLGDDRPRFALYMDDEWGFERIGIDAGLTGPFEPYLSIYDEDGYTTYDRSDLAD